MAENQNYWVLAINPGSTSTKAALYENEVEKFKVSIDHSVAELSRFKTVSEQYPFRRNAILTYLQSIHFDQRLLAAVSGRGGGLPPVQSGAYRVNSLMLERLSQRPIGEHASNLGAALAYEIANPLGIPAFIYDSVAVDELQDIARFSGMPELPRVPLTHALNMRAMALKCARNLGFAYRDLNIIVAHLGGGITMSIHERGRMVDVVKDDEGPFSSERSGGVPSLLLTELCYTGQFDRRTLLKKIKGQGGLVAYLGVNDARKVEAMIAAGDEAAQLVYRSMAYQIAKAIAQLATVVKGNVDRIVLTGGNAYSQMLTSEIIERVEFIAPVDVFPGENELEALAMGALRVVRGEETAREYDIETDTGSSGASIMTIREPVVLKM